MLSTLPVVLPIFALVLAGWGARRLHVLGPAASGELNRFVVMLALPALLFDVVAHAHWRDLWQPGFVAVFGGSSALVFGATLLWRAGPQRPVADAALDALNAAYGNTGYMGFPLTLLALGPAALPATTVAVIITVCVVFALAIVLIEAGLQAERHPLHLAGKVGRSLLRNPLLVAPALGALVPLAGVTLPGAANTVLTMLGGAASPCALVSLGLFLAEKRDAGARTGRGTVPLVALKLLGQPALAWVLATEVFALSPLLTHAAVLLAALPTGTGPFMLAEHYRREADVTARVILASTVLSVLTLAGYLATLR